jgi:hypothetical protein
MRTYWITARIEINAPSEMSARSAINNILEQCEMADGTLVAWEQLDITDCPPYETEDVDLDIYP